MKKKLMISNISKLNENAITIYGDIGEWEENTDKDLQDILQTLDKKEPLTVYINSFGGEVSNGIAMHNQLKEFEDVTVVVQGFCCSIATVIAMASKKIIMKMGSLFMIHKPLCSTYGNANDLKKSIETLDKVEESILSIYLENSTLSKEELTELMDKETFLTPQEAKEVFTNIIVEDEVQENNVNNSTDKCKVDLNAGVDVKELVNKIQEELENSKNKTTEYEKEKMLLEIDLI